MQADSPDPFVTGAAASLRLAGISAFVLRYPLARPVVTSFGAMKNRPAVLVRLLDSDGAEGWGEVWCNFPNPAAEYRAELVEQVLAPLCSGAGQSFDGPRALKDALTARTRVLVLQCGEPGPFAQCIAAIEMAAFDLVARRAGKPLWQLLGGRGEVPVYASGIHPKEADERVGAAAAQGHTRFKLKVGFSLDDDVACLRQLQRDHAAQAWMIDANQAWDESGAMAAIAQFSQLPLQWLEEPVAADCDAATWQRLAGLGLPLAGGENIRGDANFVQAAQWLSVLQPDVAKWGGVSSCLDVAAIARAAGRRFCPHWLGSGVGLAFSLALLDAHLARATPDLPGWAEVDVNPNPLRDELSPWCRGVSDGCATLNIDPGIGPVPAWDASLLVTR
ncbi:mandelate racemase/muconate lactonizing enzyme family protein [Ramlibacter sp. AN1015]|uniref:mandelate racemase/muconate lactonizing enzyme family protein n=1 Tax=Ramlibacter sp. AN1015 TaxID=3133428 RepID=UPI0030BC0D61